MGLLDGLDKFGFDVKDAALFEDNSVENASAVDEQVPVGPVEKDFLLEKKMKCPVCDHDFMNRTVIASKLRRKEPDKDLRPRFMAIDTLKYDIVSCPYCGYSAMNRYFDHLSSLQMKLIREGISSKFTASTVDLPEVYTYEQALDRYKLSLYNSIVKHAKSSEKGYICLKMAWLMRGKQEELLENGVQKDSDEYKKCAEEEKEYYAQAYEGLTKALATESSPICGMDQNTFDLLLAQMAYRLGKLEEASRFVSRLLGSTTAGHNIKERARDLKYEIIEIIRGTK